MTKVAVFNTQMVPLGHVTIKHAITRICQGKAWPIEVDRSRQFCCPDFCLFIPLSIQVEGPGFLPTPFHEEEEFSREAMLLRDNFMCSYCGRTQDQLAEKEYLTKDHVIPRSRRKEFNLPDGIDGWTNLACACSTCNFKKDNKTPEEAGMPLRRRPYAPTKAQIRHLRRKQRASAA